MEKVSENTLTNIKIMESLIARLIPATDTGSTSPHQMEQQVTGSSNLQDTQALQNQELIIINDLQTMQMQNADLQTTLITTRETIEANVIQKLKEAIEELQRANALKTKELENFMQLKNELQLQEKRFQVEKMQANNEALTKQNMLEEESHAKSEKIQNLKTKLSAIKQRECKQENKHAEEVSALESEYKTQLLELIETVAQKDALLSKLQDENSTYKFQVEKMQANNEALTKQNMWEEDWRAKSEKIQNLVSAIKQKESKHAEEISALKSDYETQLLELRKTKDSLLETIHNARTVLNMSSIKIRAEDSNLKEHVRKRVKLEEDSEALQTKSMEEPKTKRQKLVERKFFKSRSEPRTFADCQATTLIRRMSIDLDRTHLDEP